jgi:hypothetical protein
MLEDVLNKVFADIFVDEDDIGGIWRGTPEGKPGGYEVRCSGGEIGCTVYYCYDLALGRCELGVRGLGDL